MNHKLTAEVATQLQEGINLLLSRWAALRMAVENEWGGRDSRQKSQQLGLEIFHILTQSKEQVYIDDVEEMLDEFMLSLNTEIDDGSIEEIAEKLMVMHEECLEGKFDSIKKLKETNVPSVSYTRQSGSSDEDDNEDDDNDDTLRENNSSEMDIDTPQCQPGLNDQATTDEPRFRDVPEVVDGWTVVTSRRRGKKN